MGSIALDHVLPAYRWAAYFEALIRYTTFAPSSETSSAPSGATATPTGRPLTLLLEGSGTKPVRKGCGSPDGLAFLNGMNTTWYPAREARFHEPCSARNTPPE